jgi:RNA polymerase sigma factor (sigma-70 family)
MTEPLAAERLFAAYRRTRDAACLGEVFDLCADDLFAVALHLGRDRAAAEDLVQATFLVAMERAQRWDPARPLRPWLLGILQHEARALRRRDRRVPAAERMPAVDEPPPPQRAANAETMRAVTAAIPAVPQPYRDVVALHLEHALAPVAIAERLQRSPGAVRTQLWRGLALLRGLLPPGLAVGVAGEVAAAMPLAAVRVQIVALATARAAGAASGAGGVAVGVVAGAGAMLIKKILFAAAVVLGSAGLWWWDAAASDVLPAPPVANDSGAKAVAESVGVAYEREGADVADGTSVRSDAKPPESVAAAPAPTDAAPAPEPAFTPVLLPILVVRSDGTPVPDAQVESFEPTFHDSNGKREPGSVRASAVPREQTATDRNGRASLLIRGVCLVAARAAGVGLSGDIQLVPTRRRLPAELCIVLLATATVHGCLRLPDGSTARGAQVRSSHSNSHHPSHHEGELLTHRTSTRTGDDGSFALTVLAGVEHNVSATFDGKQTPLQRVGPLAAGARHQVVLRFPGAFRVTGRVLDEHGKPVVAGVRCWTKPDEPLLLPGVEKAEADADGRFDLSLVHPGTLHVVAGGPGATCALATVQLDEANPHRDLELRLRPIASVTGTVVDERGAPLADLGLWLRPAFLPELSYLGFLRNELGVRPTGLPRTDAHGAFRFEVSADCSYQLGVFPLANRDLRIDSPEFAPPVDGLTIVVRDADKLGFVIVGRVLGSDGALLRDCRVGLRKYEPASRGVMDYGTSLRSEGTFRFGPLQPGEHFGVEVQAEGYANQVVGPFVASVREEPLTVRMQRCGTVQCRIVRADGAPAVGAFSSLQRLPKPDPLGRAWQGETDRDGRITFRDVEPGEYHVWAKPTRAASDTSQATAVTTVVQPDRVTEVRVVLRP